jgi:ring-1,2-phenylacetyl-CoA epoxidase subunit PaaC
MTQEYLFSYLLQLGDNALIHGQRLAQWCGHGPVLEQDIALTNIALDHIGQARMFYQLAASVEGNNRTEDDLAFKRDAHEFRNCQLVELPNGHFGDTIAKCFFLDTYNYFYFDSLRKSAHSGIAAIAEKAFKEISYHAQFAAEWVIRLGDGTAESHQKIAESINNFYPYTGGLFNTSSADAAAQEAGYAPNLKDIEALWFEKVTEVLEIATLTPPDPNMWMHKSGKDGQHTEHIGFMLAEMQFLPRAYPDATW